MKVVVFTIHNEGGSQNFLVGVQVSKILQRMTFNLYKSLKRKGVMVRRASPHQVCFLIRTHSVPPNTHSVSLIPYDGAKNFIHQNFKWIVEDSGVVPSAAARPMLSQSRPQKVFHPKHLYDCSRNFSKVDTLPLDAWAATFTPSFHAHSSLVAKSSPTKNPKFELSFLLS